MVQILYLVLFRGKLLYGLWISYIDLMSVRKLRYDLRERLAFESLSINGRMTILNHNRFRRCILWEQGVLAKHSILGGANCPLLGTG
jgi:hypothetical protein